jgi:acyl-CoA synthetase (AMP-forming)/AMP-acid ligase II
MKHFLKPDQKDLDAIVCGHSGASLTFGELHRQTYSLASNLRTQLGINEGDVVAVMSPNNINYFQAMNGTCLAGAISTTINPLYTKEEILHQLNLTEAKVILAHPLCHAAAAAAAAARGIPLLNIDSAAGIIDGAVAMNDLLNESESSLDYDSFAGAPGRDFDENNTLATIPFSSGTTGLAKGVMLSHRNVVANVLQIQPAEGQYLRKNKTRTGDRGVLLCPLPYVFCSIVLPFFSCL